MPVPFDGAKEVSVSDLGPWKGKGGYAQSVEDPKLGSGGPDRAGVGG